MENETKKLKPVLFIRELCKEKTEEQILEAELNFTKFLLVIKEVANRLEMENKTLADFDD